MDGAAFPVPTHILSYSIILITNTVKPSTQHRTGTIPLLSPVKVNGLNILNFMISRPKHFKNRNWTSMLFLVA